MSPQIEIQLIAVITASACAIPGVFLVLRKMAMMSDSITHTILLGIVLCFFITQDLSSPLLIIGAGAMGIITVWLTEMLNKTKLISEDSAIGMIFPLLFSIAIILISKYAGSVHLDTDSVLLGELAFAPFDRLIIAGKDIGSKSLYLSGVMMVINLSAVILFFKELKLVTFDPILAGVIGISPVIFHYGLMSIVSVTAVAAFQTAGSVLVVAFMIGPPAAAYLLTDNLKTMILLSIGLGAISAVVGCQAAIAFDVSIAGSIAVAIGLLFFIAFLFSPQRGFAQILAKRQQQKTLLSKNTLLLHLYHHKGLEEEIEEAGTDTIVNHLQWKKKDLNKITNILRKERLIFIQDNTLRLTEKGFAVSKDLDSSF